MSIDVETYSACPHCNQKILYHCCTPKQIQECKWMQLKRQLQSDMLRDATNSSDLRYRMWRVNQEEK